jgi:hypothetical protein
MPQLIQLKPGSGVHSQIECVTIPGGGRDIEYTALSYTVSPEDLHQHTITIDGVKHGVSDVLYSALGHLGQSDDSLTMWIDPICLNPDHAPQDPLLSLTSQKAIYNNASKIAIWLGEPRQTTSSWFGAVEAFKHLGKSCSISQELLETMFDNELAPAWAWMQPLFCLPWWHWAHVEALLALEDPSKVVFCCGTERMSWDSFMAVVRILRYALPRVEADYSPWLDQILLQIPGRLPEALREIFYDEIAAAGSGEETPWGKGVLFAHPQDIHYDLNSAAESDVAGRLMTSLSARLANRYRRRCILDLKRRDNTGDAAGGDQPHFQNLEREDVSLTHWLHLLEESYRNRSSSAHEVILRTIAASETAILPSTMSMRTSVPDDHTPLNAADHEIRILVLYPNEERSADVVCETFNFNVKEFSEMGTERFPYLALSYVCGNPEPKKTIWFRGEEKTVTPNLFEALEGLRDPFVPMLLWVDALCIDQSNSEEVKSQIALMHIVYGGAGAVLAWINSQSNDASLTRIAMMWLTDLERIIYGVLYDIGQPSAKQPLWKEWNHSIKGGYGPLEAFDNLLRSPYFSRVWTIQEVFLNRNVIICHGGLAVYFRTLLFKAVQDGRWATVEMLASGDGDSANVHADMFLSSYYRMLCGQPPSVLEALLLAQDRRATEKHDSIYGILGLLDRSGMEVSRTSASAWQEVDYKQDYYHVCLKVCKHILWDTRNLDILSACEVRRHYESDPAVSIKMTVCDQVVRVLTHT